VRLLDAERIDRVVAVDVLRRSDMRRFWVGLKERVSGHDPPRQVNGQKN
jgi:hypothetical protein